MYDSILPDANCCCLIVSVDMLFFPVLSLLIRLFLGFKLHLSFQFNVLCCKDILNWIFYSVCIFKPECSSRNFSILMFNVFLSLLMSKFLQDIRQGAVDYASIIHRKLEANHFYDNEGQFDVTDQVIIFYWGPKRAVFTYLHLHC